MHCKAQTFGSFAPLFYQPTIRPEGAHRISHITLSNHKAYDASGRYTSEQIIESFLFEVATNLSPSGIASGDITFTWIGISVPGTFYQVALSDETGNDIW